MAITLDGLALPDNIIWENEFDWTDIAASVELTLGGRPVIWEGSVTKARPIDLVATEDLGWLTRAQINSLMEKAETLGWTGVLNYEGTSLKVRFRNEDSPTISMRPKVPRPNHADGDYYTGRIKLMEIN